MTTNQVPKPNAFEELKDGEYFVNRPTSRPLDFEEDYWKEGGKPDPDGNCRDIHTERERKLEDCKSELAYINALKPGKFLDVGCGIGWFLSGVSDKWQRYGVEISEYAASKASRWADVFTGELADADYQPASFDAVLCYHVIEHVTDPVGLIRSIHKVMKPGGKFVLGTPDFDSGCARRYGENYRMLHDTTHISLFSEQGLRNILEDHGFVVEHVDKPYFDTPLFTQENLTRLIDKEGVSPPFYGNIINLYCRSIDKNEALACLEYKQKCYDQMNLD